jgi:hypothetical protein
MNVAIAPPVARRQSLQLQLATKLGFDSGPSSLCQAMVQQQGGKSPGKGKAMNTHWIHQLEQWREFFLLSGSAGGILTAVLFVVISLDPSVIAADRGIGVRACVSPNVVHFAVVLVVSNALMAHAIPQDFTGWILCIGAALCLLYLWSIRSEQPWHERGIPVMDRIWYIALPYFAYAAALAAGIGVLREDAWALPLIAAVMLLLLAIGVRNAWDLAVWLPVQETRTSQPRDPAGP